ncbi:hypothetical protein GOY13_01780 [Wolbachia endosymbiont of Cruorifilaria tuberocauda]|nr:hypothetical protein GOY13_01780 [Wolbachia endosymbiont of Cruorifilaria tuberocauda]
MGITAEKIVNDLKSSIFCGIKGFLTFNLAFLSYLECSLRHNAKLQGSAAFAMKSNAIPFLEMLIITPLVCFVLPAMIGNISIMKRILICAISMIVPCFLVRNFYVREKLLEKITDYSKKTVETEFKESTIKFPIFYQKREYNEPSNTSFFVESLIFPLKFSQSCFMLSLATVELLEVIPIFFVDLCFDRDSFISTSNNLHRSSNLLYASVENLVPVSIFDGLVAECVSTLATCCSI